MGLDCTFVDPSGKTESFFLRHSRALLRTVHRMPHINLELDYDKLSFADFKKKLLCHIAMMATHIDTYIYPTTWKQYYTDTRPLHRVTLQSDLEVIAALIQDLNNYDIPDHCVSIFDS
jgi:hypothetical protein